MKDFNHRSHVGPAGIYDIISAQQFTVLTKEGLRETNALLDIGCGSLRGGRLFIVYLQKGKYFGIEPNYHAVQAGIQHELGADTIHLKKPQFSKVKDFSIEFPEQDTFDFILAQSILSHTSLKEAETCIKNVAKRMTKGSVFIATYFRGGEDYEGNKWKYPGSVKFKPVTMERLASEAGLSFEELEYSHPSQQTWVKMVKGEK